MTTDQQRAWVQEQLALDRAAIPAEYLESIRPGGPQEEVLYSITEAFIALGLELWPDAAPPPRDDVTAALYRCFQGEDDALRLRRFFVADGVLDGQPSGHTP